GRRGRDGRPGRRRGARGDPGRHRGPARAGRSAPAAPASVVGRRAQASGEQEAPLMPTGDLDAALDRLVRDVRDYPTPGVVFKDITPLLADPQGFAAVVDALVAGQEPGGVDAVVGIEARGFILAAP